MYCVHGHKNGHFVSLVYALLQGKSEIVYLWDSISSSEKNTDFGLKTRLKDSSNKIGKRLEHSFGLYLLCPDVEDSFCEDVRSATPEDHRCSKYADYLFENYVTPLSKCGLKSHQTTNVVILLYGERKGSYPGN